MCGACGSTVYADPVMGDEQTLRKRMLVARAVTSIVAGLPGVPRVTARAEGWTAAGPTGSITLCHTVADIWTAVLERNLPRVQQMLESQVGAAEPGSLAAQVADVGVRLARQKTLASQSSGSGVTL